MKRILAKVVSTKVKPYRGKLSPNDKKIIDQAIMAWSNDRIADFYDDYGIWPEEFIAKNMDKCLALYGNKKKVTIYRALHFISRAKLLRFIDSLDNGILVEKKIRSWTTDKDVAMRFFNHRGIVKSADENFGCLLVQDIMPKQGLELQVNKYFEYNEDEIVLPPGTFKVQLLDYTVTNQITNIKPLKKWDSYVKQLNKRYK